jgi:hypothetical protein
MLPTLVARRLHRGATASFMYDTPEELSDAFKSLAEWLIDHPYSSLIAVSFGDSFVEFIFDSVDDEDLVF